VAERNEHARRFPRLRARCRVVLRDRYGVWEAETEDLGPRGCRIVAPRAQTVGTVVGLTIASELLTEKLEVTGQVVWSVWSRPARAGISFAGSASTPGASAPSPWFAALAAADPAAVIGGTGPIVLPVPEWLEVRIDDGPGELEGPELARRLADRARELLAAGLAPRAVVLLRRAVALAPADVALAALLEEAVAAVR
jgi:hypothetical protein